MDTDRLNRWLSLGANVGVLTGILLLVFELDQNRAMMRAQTRNELSSNIVNILNESAGNNQLASILRRANAGEELTPDEFFQFQERQAAMYRYWENVHYQYRQGLYDESEFSKQRDAWRVYVNQSKAVADEWCGMRDLVSKDFVAEVDSLLTEFAC
jgi:hypothetical protein